jgi:hypothetical protein
MRPSLTFFCELPSSEISAFFADGKVISDLKKLDSNLALGLLDLTDERAGVVKKLNRAAIPVTAWILLPKEQGYWTSLDTVAATRRQFGEFRSWQAQHKLEFAAIGLDIEPPLIMMAALGLNPIGQLKILATRLITNWHKQLTLEMTTLVRAIQADGYAVETYQFPTVVDERQAKSNVFAKTLGLPVIESDREVLMLYSSFFPAHSDSILWSYACQAKAVGVGSTGGGVEINGLPSLKTMRWIDLKRDLLLASQVVDHVYIFSLEGCVTNHYMERLIDLDWNTQVIPPFRSAQGISLIRKIAQGLLWSLSHPIQFLIGLLMISTIYQQIRKWFK